MPPSVNPALCTTASMRPNACKRGAHRASGALLGARGRRGRRVAWPPAAMDRVDHLVGRRPASAPVPNSSVPASATTTRAPRAASSSAWHRPMPRPAPVTSTTRSSNRSSSGRLLGEAARIGALRALPAGDDVWSPMLHADVVPHHDVAVAPLVQRTWGRRRQRARTGEPAAGRSRRGRSPTIAPRVSVDVEARRPVWGCGVNTGCIASASRGSSEGGG